MQRHDSRHNEVIFHAEARWLSRGKVLERVFQLWQELRVFLAQEEYQISTNFQGNFWLYLNLNSVSWIVQPFTYEEIELGFPHVAATTQKTAGHGTRGRNEVGQGGWNSLVPSHYGGAQWLRRRRKVPTMSQVLFFSVEHVLPKDPSFEYGSTKLASCPARHLTSLRPCTAHETIKLMKVNLPAHEVRTTPSMNKKRNHLIYCDCSRWISSASCEKCGLNPVSRAFFIRGSTSLIEFVYFILFRQEQKIIASKGRLLACDQKRNSLNGWDFGIQECWEVVLKNLMWKRHLQRKIAYILHFNSTKFSCSGKGVQVF